MTTLTLVSKDNNFANESTTYWFDVSGETYGVVESCGETSFVDCDGSTISADTVCATDAHIISALETAVTDEMRMDF